MLWRVSLAVLAGSPVVLPIVGLLLMCIFGEHQFGRFGIPVLAIVVDRCTETRHDRWIGTNLHTSTY